MASKQLEHMNELYASIKERLSKPDIDLATRPKVHEIGGYPGSYPG